jgi:hypothetical protein
MTSGRYYTKKPHSDAYYEARNHYKEVSERAGGKGDSYRRVDKSKFDKNYERIFGKKVYWWEKRKK